MWKGRKLLESLLANLVAVHEEESVGLTSTSPPYPLSKKEGAPDYAA